MGITNGVIRYPVNPYEIYAFFGYTPVYGVYDTGEICLCPKINKWSWVKPIRHTNIGILSNGEFIGLESDNNNGIYNGIQIGTVWGRLIDIQEASFDYVAKPDGKNYPFRLLDFDGYDHYALPNPMAGFRTTAMTRAGTDGGGNNLDVQIRYDTLNTTGFDLVKIAANIAQQAGISNLANYYPVVIFSTSPFSRDNAILVHALKNSDTKTYTTFFYNNKWQTDWYLDCADAEFNNYYNENAGSNIKTFFPEGGTKTLIASLALVPTKSGSGYNLEKWCSAGAGSPSWDIGNSFGLPEGVQKTINYKYYANPGTNPGYVHELLVQDFYATTGNTGLTMVVKTSTSTSASREYYVSVSTSYRTSTLQGGYLVSGTGSKTFTLQRVLPNQNYAIGLSWDNDLRVTAPASGTLVTVTYQLGYYNTSTGAFVKLDEGTSYVTI